MGDRGIRRGASRPHVPVPGSATSVKKFLANPDLYSPVLSGNDPVLALDNQVVVPGRREFGVFSDNRDLSVRRRSLAASDSSRTRSATPPKRCKQPVTAPPLSSVDVHAHDPRASAVPSRASARRLFSTARSGRSRSSAGMAGWNSRSSTQFRAISAWPVQ